MRVSFSSFSSRLIWDLEEGEGSGDELNQLSDTEDDIDQDAQDYATLLKELNEGDDNWEGETGLGKDLTWTGVYFSCLELVSEYGR